MNWAAAVARYFEEASAYFDRVSDWHNIMEQWNGDGTMPKPFRYGIMGCGTQKKSLLS